MKIALKSRREEGAQKKSRKGGSPTRGSRYEYTTTWGAYPTWSIGKPVPELNDEVGSFFTWTKQMTSWAVSNTCEGAFKETENIVVFQGPKAKSREEFDFQFGRETVASARRAYERITTAVSNSSLPPNVYQLGSPSLEMEEVCRTHVPIWTCPRTCVAIATRRYPMGRHLPFALRE